VLPNWVPEIETKPAPGDLLLLQAFVNTYEADTGIDVLTERARANSWLHQSGLVTAAVDLDDSDLARLRHVREAFRMLLLHNAGLGNPGPADIALLNESLGDSAIVLHVDTEDQYGVHAVPTGTDPVGTAIVRLLLIVREAQREGTWSRLKVCSRDDCRWAYYDRSHSHRGRWCDMATCGNRVKNQALRLRRQNN
jgi:predicted RNA-binding Zn ribbon-like protein